MGEIRLTERDYTLFRELERWRVCLGRHIRVLAGFAGQRACDRRLHALIASGFLTRKKILYGVPGIYSNTYQAKLAAGLPAKTEKIRVEQIAHDIAVLDTAIQLQSKLGFPWEDVTTEKQLHMQDGFGNRRHRPDFMYAQNGESTCVEVSKCFQSGLQRAFYIFDEISSYASPSLIDLINKSRSANITSILATQSLSDFEFSYNEAFKEQVIENCNNYIVLRQNSSKNAEQWASVLGTRNSMDVTYQIQQQSRMTNVTGLGSARRVREFLYHPDDIKSLQVGKAFYLSKDSAFHCKLAVNKPI